ncbi:molybdenum cofactor guanylyltransferase [Edaphobacter acidisoli]|uniref:Probable molybdenum cofactor guanylyltransferase n=1 Tax=Edaphobacter acidisoli TaxID=2040573 RepID=A0A916W4T4_9BACT|nr:molybdenum cofactor guanylyltransferase [Edaphobacter acidisoli]GGA65945.1 molybdenum cofactor guanylyltransferase [Edaphobacter acidisoli]
MTVEANPPVKAAGFVLAGGRSTRMGQDKAILQLGGLTLVERCLGKLRTVCDEVAIAGGKPELERYGRVIPDEAPGCGPLGGIVAALEQSAHEWNLFLPVDAPFVPDKCLRELLQVAAVGDWAAVIARADGRLQPLCGVYSRTMLPALRRELAEGRWKVAPALELAGRVHVMDFANVKWFANLNTPAEFAEAAEHADALDA